MTTPGKGERPEDLGSSAGHHAAVVPAAGSVTGLDRRLATVVELGKIALTALALESMLQQLLDCLVASLEAADAGALLLYDPADRRLVVQATCVYDLPRLKQIRLAPGEARCGRALLSGRPELYPTPEAIAAAVDSAAPANGEIIKTVIVGLKKPQSSVCLPLVAGAKKVGALMLDNLHRTAAFTAADLPFLEAVAELIAAAVEGARQREALQSGQAIAEANRLKAELISTLAHEMRTPLTSVKGYSTALLMDDVTFSPETQREFLQFIDEECDVLQALIYDLLESSIIDAGLLRLEPQPVKLPSLVRSVTDDIARHTKIHRFLIDFPERFPILDADPDRIAQVLRNLVDNAVKYSPDGGLIVVRGEVRRREVVISVSDQGVGLSPEHLNRLFEKFFRAKSSLGRHVVGSGLGLPICRTIVESHGGRIWAESQVGQGTTLYFTLPLEGLSHASRELGEE
ncbi:MAG TPA: ATP-binding protein [Anaerolineae bacterium]|nr:ATP-binding protein [Anaerolineae bacterium]